MWSNTYKNMPQLAQAACDLGQGITEVKGKEILSSTYISRSLRADERLGACRRPTAVIHF